VKMLTQREQLVWVHRLCVLAKSSFTVYLESAPSKGTSNSVTKVTLNFGEVNRKTDSATLTASLIDERIKDGFKSMEGTNSTHAVSGTATVLTKTECNAIGATDVYINCSSVTLLVQFKSAGDLYSWLSSFDEKTAESEGNVSHRD